MTIDDALVRKIWNILRVPEGNFRRTLIRICDEKIASAMRNGDLWVVSKFKPKSGVRVKVRTEFNGSFIESFMTWGGDAWESESGERIISKPPHSWLYGSGR